MAQPLSPSGVALGLINKYDGDLAVSIHQQDLEEDDSCDFDEDLAASLQQQELEDNGSSSLVYPEVLRHASSDNLTQKLDQWRLPTMNIVPRTNSSTIPASVLSGLTDVVSPDRSRLLLRLDQYGLTERKITGDGACQLYGSQDHHRVVRGRVIDQLRAHPELYSMYVPTSFTEYCNGMSKETTWGDHVTLKAASDVFGLLIMVLTSFKENCIIKIEPKEFKSRQRVLWLSFWAEVHYNSVYPKE